MSLTKYDITFLLKKPNCPKNLKIAGKGFAVSVKKPSHQCSEKTGTLTNNVKSLMVKRRYVKDQLERGRRTLEGRLPPSSALRSPAP